MKNQNKPLRIYLESDVSHLLLELLEGLKQESQFVKINSQRLNAWIIRNFYEKYFTSEMDNIIKEFFDQKHYFQHVLKNIEDGKDASKMLEEALNNLKRPNEREKEKENKKKRPKDSILDVTNHLE